MRRSIEVDLEQNDAQFVEQERMVQTAINRMQHKESPAKQHSPISHRAMTREYGDAGTYGVAFGQDSIMSEGPTRGKKFQVNTYTD
jgi:hypothetical protein